ncbi:metallophosphoesterase family protein [Brassicibacter mesophilus]|uniref:metallophosphoesterase family protein n=1 Tax=Brassicibacter mesophilus TaxID=745119 RepID=UPI003D21E46C
MEIKFIHTGDLHLGMEFKNASFDSKHSNIRRLELWETFDRIIDKCKQINAHFLLIAGDLLEEAYCTIGDVKRINSKFKEIKDTKVVLVAGNHDTLGKRSLYRLIKWEDNVHIFESNQITKLEFKDLNTIIWGLSWDKKEEKRNLADNIKIEDQSKINILLVHGDMLNKDSEYLPMNKNVIIDKGFDYVALGHIHKPQFITEKICYCGSPEPLDFGETGMHGIVEVSIAEKDTKANFIPFSKREFLIKEINIIENMNYNDIIDEIRSCDSYENRMKNLYRIVMKGIRDSDISLRIDDIKDLVTNDFNYIEIVDKTVPDYDLDKIYKENSNNIIGYFIREMEKKGLEDVIVKDALYSGLDVLLNEKVRK